MTCKSIEIPDCHYTNEPFLVCPNIPTPKHTLYLSNLDDQKFLRFSIKYLYVFKQSLSIEELKASLSRVLVPYYPLAGRLRATGEDKLEVDCNGEGAVMVQGFVGISANEFLDGSSKPNKSWRKLLFRVETQSFVGVPPLVIQVTNLGCGGMIICTAINHCLCDGVGTSQFLHAWAQATVKPDADLSVTPFHSRDMLKPRKPRQVHYSHPEFRTNPNSQDPSSNLLNQFLLCQPLTPISLTFTSSHILQLKKQCTPSLKCTSFETLAVHVWRAWAKSLDLPSTLQIKLLFSVNVRKRLEPELPQGFYGNGFVLGCAETLVDQLVTSNPYYGVKLVQLAKQFIHDDYVRSMIDLLEEKRARPDLSASLVISAWSRLGLEDLDFGVGRPLHMGPLTSEIYCVFAPVAGDVNTITVMISVPQGVAEQFEYYCLNGLDEREEREDLEGVNGERFCEVAS